MKKIIHIVFTLVLANAVAFAQSTIPNASFENWTTINTYNVPDSWGCCNPMTSIASTYTCMKGTPGVAGSSYLKLVSKNVSGKGVVPGIAVCGKMDTTTLQPVSGFPFSSRPKYLTGSWQHMIYGSDQGFIDIKLTRWDGTNRVVVASAHNVLSGMAMSWATFSIPLTYADSGTPDSCIIVMSASGATATASDYLWVDNLAFTGSVTGIGETMSDFTLKSFPNPSSTQLYLDLSSITRSNVSIEIYDVQGKVVKTVNSLSISSKSQIDITDLNKGNYFLYITTDKGIITNKFIKE